MKYFFLLFFLLGNGLWAATLTSAYEFEGNLSDSIINGYDPLLVSGTHPTNPGSGSIINGEFVFGVNQGLRMLNGLVNINNYSVELYFRLANTSNYAAIMDPGARTEEMVYAVTNGICWWPTVWSNTGLAANVYAHVILTRASSGEFKGYTNNTLSISAFPSYTSADGNLIHFFEDNNGEATSGAVQYIRIYDGVLNSSEINTLYQNRNLALSVPEPNLYYMFMTGMLLFFFVFKKNKF